MPKRHRRASMLRPDLTPFVSVALLLIVFFVWLKQLQRPNALAVNTIGKPWPKYEERFPTDAILFLTAHNRVGILRFIPATDTAEFIETDHTSGLQRFLKTLRHYNPRVTVVIRPTAQATFGDVVYVLSALKHAGNMPYLLDTYIDADEATLLAYYASYKPIRQLQGASIVALTLYDRLFTATRCPAPALPGRRRRYQ